MDLSEALQQNGALHHAYLIVGAPRAALVGLKEFVRDRLAFGTTDNHPDFWYREFDVFGIADSRELRERSSRAPSVAGRQVFVLDIHFITAEAQNALLKTFEEPSRQTHLFILARSEHLFLPTLRSRCQVLYTGKAEEVAPELDALCREFAASAPAGRLKLVQKLLDEAEAEGKKAVVGFLNHLEWLLRSQADFRLHPEAVSVFEELGKCRGYLHDRSSSPRLILEHLSFVVPAGKAG